MKVARFLTISMAGAKERFVWRQQQFFETTEVYWCTSFIPGGNLFSMIPSFMRTIYVKIFNFTAYSAKISGSVISEGQLEQVVPGQVGRQSSSR